MGVVLDEQQESDRVEIVNDIKFVVDEDIAFLFDTIEIKFTKGRFGNSFVVVDKNRTTSC